MLAPDIDPIALQIGPLAVRWYGLMYLIGFAAAWGLGRYRAQRADWNWPAQRVDDLIFYGALGLVVGARLGYILFYNFSAFLDDPAMLLRVWQGGMSFHGGLLGVLVAFWLFARREGLRWFQVVDFIVPFAPLGLLAGRMGNFINGELWGRVSDAPWAMVFKHGGPLPRHPSQLYEAFLEGIVLFAILMWFSRKPRPTMAITGLFGVGYGSFRFLVEFVREPDAHLGPVALGWMTMGQVLSLPLIIAGGAMMVWAYKKG